MGRHPGRKKAAALVQGSGLALLVAGSLLAAPAPAGAAKWLVTVRGNAAELGETPVVAEVPANVPPGDYTLRAEDAADGGRAQVYADAGKNYFAAVLKRVPARREVVYTMTPEATSRPNGAGVEVRPSGKDLEVLVGGKPFTVYRADEATKPYYYPVIGPTGAPFTRAYPMKTDVAGEDKDHPHQRSLWFTHGSVNGFDFWASDPVNKPSPKFGTIRETSRPTVASGAAAGVIRTTDDWLGPDGKKVCEDVRVMTVYDTATARVLDFDITVKATAGPVIFGDTKEGMFGLRVASSMDVTHKQGGKITNAEGINDDAAWGKASPWVDYTGPVDGKTVGIAVLNHPESFRYPTTWHVRTYGLFAANPFGYHDFGRKDRGDYTIEPGQSIRFRYRVVFHEGDTASARVADAFRAYSEPPAVKVASE
jgi:hypothetical protein